MGNTPKIIEIKGTDPATAFTETQEEARHIFGHSGQTGTIADADGFIVVQGTPLLPWDCRRAAQQLLRDGHASPGGPVFLLAVADPKRNKTVKTVIDITDMTPGQVDDAIDTAVREKLPDQDWGIVSVETRDSDAEGDERKGVTKIKPIITNGTGTRITKYVVKHTANGTTIIEHDALSAAKNWMKEALAAGSAPMYIVAETRKTDGPLVVGSAMVTKQTIALTATIAVPAESGNGTYLATGIFPTAD